MRSAFRPLIAIVIAGGVVLAACGSSSDEGGGTTAGTEASGGAAKDCQPVKDGVLSVVTSLPGPNFWGTKAAEVDPGQHQERHRVRPGHGHRQGLRPEDGVPERELRRHRGRPGRRGLLRHRAVPGDDHRRPQEGRGLLGPVLQVGSGPAGPEGHDGLDVGRREEDEDRRPGVDDGRVLLPRGAGVEARLRPAELPRPELGLRGAVVRTGGRRGHRHPDQPRPGLAVER